MMKTEPPGRSSEAMRSSQALARKIAGGVDRHGGVEAVLARHFGRVADERLDPLPDFGFRRKEGDVIRVRRHASHRSHPSAEFLRPEDRSAAKAAADVEDFAAQGLRRIPDLGRVAEHPLLPVDQRPAQLGDRRMFRRRNGL